MRTSKVNNIFEATATAPDVAEFPLARTFKSGTTEGREGLRRDFDPVARPEKGRGKGKHQRPIFQGWNSGHQGSGWSDDWGRSEPASSSAAPLDPANPPRAAASAGDTAASADPVVTEVSQQPPIAPIVSEEYCEINGIPHYKRTFADGTVEFESW